jgi:hypothetical protein
LGAGLLQRVHIRCVVALPRCGAQQIAQSSEQHDTRPLNVVDIVSKPWSIQRICDLILDSCYAVVVGPGHFSAGHLVAGGRVACLFAERGNIPRVAGCAKLSLWRLLYLWQSHMHSHSHWCTPHTPLFFPVCRNLRTVRIAEH